MHATGTCDACLDEKGFTLDGAVHPSVAINHYLLTGGAVEDDETEP